MNAAQLRETVDLYDLAGRLNIKRNGNGNYHTPWRLDNNSSLSIFGKGKKWKDHGSDKGGSCLDLVSEVQGISIPEAMRFLHQEYGFPVDRASNDDLSEVRESRGAYAWRKNLNHVQINQAVSYLTEVRKLPDHQVQAWKGKAFGYSDWLPDSGSPDGHGPAVAFPVTDSSGKVVGVNLRYLAENHNPKMRFIGDVAGGMFCPEAATLKAPIVWFVESPIDALTLCAAGCPAVAFLSASMVEKFPFSWLGDRQQIMILADADQAGRRAAETLYHRALSAGITVQMVDWWQEYKDPNAALQEGKSLEEVGERAKTARIDLFPAGAPFIPESELKRLDSYVCGLDAMEIIRYKKTEDGPEKTIEPVAGFRVYRVDPITVHDPQTALGGSAAGFSAHRSLVTFRRADSAFLHRQIIDQAETGKHGTWQQFGHLHNPRYLSRMLQSLSRDRRHANETVNVFGLVHVGGRLRLNDKRTAFMTDEECVYHRLQFPSAPRESAGPLVGKMSRLLKDEKALILLGWHLGSFMKVFLGFWPHMAISAHAGAGKTTVVEILSALTGSMSVEPTELQTSYRRMKLLSNHLYPVVFDELSRAGHKDLNAFVDLLNASFRYQIRHHGQKKAFLVAAPVCMIGQDNPVEDAAFSSKTVQFDLDHAKGELFEPDGPFPVQEWAAWLSERLDREKAKERLEIHQKALMKTIQQKSNDGTIERFVLNYAAVSFALEELFEFSGCQIPEAYNSIRDLMHRHLRDSAGIRRESIAILDRFVRELMLIQDKEQPPFRVQGNHVVFPPSVVLDFLKNRGHEFPVKTVKSFVKHLIHDGFLVERGVQMRFKGQRFSKCVVLDMEKLAQAGIDWPTADFEN
jgi:hypothetical protein